MSHVISHPVVNLISLSHYSFHLTMIPKYYKKLFSSSNLHEKKEVVQFTKKVVTGEMNNCLIKKIIKDEVEITLKKMAPLKAPGPDGMPPIFFPTLLGKCRR